jgi:hypothetical protein
LLRVLCFSALRTGARSLDSYSPAMYSYTTSQSNPQYRLPSFNANVAYQPRIVQLGFRFAF